MCVRVYACKYRDRIYNGQLIALSCIVLRRKSATQYPLRSGGAGIAFWIVLVCLFVVFLLSRVSSQAMGRIEESEARLTAQG